MTETTTTETMPSASELADAQTRYADADAWLRSATPGDPKAIEKVDEKIRAHAVIDRARRLGAASAAPGMTPEQRLDAIGRRKQTHAALLRDDLTPEERQAHLERAVTQSNALAAERPLYSAEDFARVLADGGISATDHERVQQTFTRLGLSGVEAMQAALALRDSPVESEDTLTEDELAARVEAWWGPDTDAKLEAADRGWALLRPDERRAMNSRRGSRPFMEQMAKLGQRRTS